MFFSGKKTNPGARANAPDKKGVSVGSLFNPNIGNTLRPLGETGKMLVSIIAAIFAANGLFPRNHPALLGNSNERLTLGEVIRTGWRNVSFTRERMPQALLFCAVMLSLSCSVIAIAVALIMAFIGTAHAQAPTGAAMFEPPPADDNDIACGWINWLFGTQMFGCDLQDYLQPLGNGQTIQNLQSTFIQNALILALGFYSDVVLVVAAVVLFYHLTAMTVETAHHGVVMGRRANQVWAPIRLVAAVGLLVPIANGLNSGQYIVIQIVQWGSAVASNAWSIFLAGMEQDDFNYVPPLAGNARAAVVDTVLMEACTEAYNDMQNGSGLQAPPNIPAGGVQRPAMPDGSVKVSFSPQDPATANPSGADVDTDVDLCGFYIIPPLILANGNEQALMQAVHTAAINAFNTFIPAAATFGQTTVQNYIPCKYTNGVAPCASSQLPPNSDFETLAYQYTGDLQQQFLGVNGTLTNTMQAIIAASQAEGWVSAGAWFNTIAKLQGDIDDLAKDTPFQTEPPQIMKAVQENKVGPGDPQYFLGHMMVGYYQWLDQEFNPNLAANANLQAEQQQLMLTEGLRVQNQAANQHHYMDGIFGAVDQIATEDGVWSPAVTTCGGASCFTLGARFTTYNPLAEIAHLGHANINTAYQLFDDYVNFLGAASAGKDLGQAITALSGTGQRAAGVLAKVFSAGPTMAGEALSAIGAIIGMACIVFFTAGFMLAFFLPLIPFYRFIFGILSWFLGLLEAIVAAPLVALAHLTPEGEGFMGEKAKAAYYFVFNLFLKPTLMVFGLVAGFLIFELAASVMNLLYTTAVAGGGGVSNGHYTLARLVYSIIYVVILYLCCNNCFQLIEWLPEHAMKWMGSQGMHTAQMGNPNEIAGYMGVGSSIVENRIVQGTGQFMGGPAGFMALGALANSKEYGATARGIGNDSISKMVGGGAAGKALNAGLAETAAVSGQFVGAMEKGGAIAAQGFAAGRDALLATNPTASAGDQNKAGITGAMAKLDAAVQKGGAEGANAAEARNALQGVAQSLGIQPPPSSGSKAGADAAATRSTTGTTPSDKPPSSGND